MVLGWSKIKIDFIKQCVAMVKLND